MTYYKTLILTTLLASMALAQDQDCGTYDSCFLVNLESGHEMLLDGNDEYKPMDSEKGWSIKCKVRGKVDYMKYKFAQEVSTQYYDSNFYHEPSAQPFWMAGDNDRQHVNAVPYLDGCSDKNANAIFFTWHGTDEYPCFEKHFTLRANCGGGQAQCQAEKGGCGSGEKCCEGQGLSCQWATDGNRLCLGECSPHDSTCCFTKGRGCGSGETCCDGTTCQWTDGGHRRCLPQCQTERGGCGSGEECCDGTTCQWAPDGNRLCLGQCSPHDNSCCFAEGRGCGSGETCCDGTTCQWADGGHRRCLRI